MCGFWLPLELGSNYGETREKREGRAQKRKEEKKSPGSEKSKRKQGRMACVKKRVLCLLSLSFLSSSPSPRTLEKSYHTGIRLFGVLPLELALEIALGNVIVQNFMMLFEYFNYRMVRSWNG